jgi:PAS domain S-box-containing protein
MHNESIDNIDNIGTTCRYIVEGMSEAMIFSDPAGVIRLWNPGAQALFGYTPDEAFGQSLDLIIPERLREAHWKGFHRAMQQGVTAHGRVSIITRSLHKEGGQLYVDMSFAVVRNQAGETIGSVAIARNATERHLQEKSLRQQLAALQANATGGAGGGAS